MIWDNFTEIFLTRRVLINWNEVKKEDKQTIKTIELSQDVEDETQKVI